MSGVAIISYMLVNNAAVTDLVPATRIISAAELPVGTALPAILVSQISGDEERAVDLAVTKPGRLQIERVQVTVHAATYAAQKQLLALVRSACGTRAAAVNSGFDVDSIHPAGVGPDLSQRDASIFEQSRDVVVKWRTR